MTENTDEEHFENPVNNQPENPPDQIIPPNDSETITPNQEIENMEIHHHAHHGGKKNWKAFFWEFIMLFLAVFCGFLAEYQLEQTIERHREKELITSLIEDLKKDTTSLGVFQDELKTQKLMMDSLVFYLTASDLKEKGAEVYYYGRKPSRFVFFNYTDRTIQQLKNAGSFRLIKKPTVADSILKYYSHFELISILQNGSFERIDEYTRTSRQLFNPLVFEEIVSDETYNKITKPTGNPPLMTYEQNSILEVISIIHSLKSSNRGLQVQYTMVKKEAEYLINFLKNNYHLD